MKWFYHIYQYIAFLVLYPLSVYIWYLDIQDMNKVLMIILLPLIVAYIIPFLGTNVTKLWKFNTRFKIGNFRAYHGFVLGAIINIFGFFLYKISPINTGILNTVFFALISGSFIAFWNWYYDIYAVKYNFMEVHNKLAYEGKSAHEIVTDYAPTYFFAFGFIYGLNLKILEYYFENSFTNIWLIELIMIVCALTIPTLIYAVTSKIRHGIWGVSEYKGE